MDKLQILGQSWSIVARGYKDHFVPRFSPWIADSIATLVREIPQTPGVIFAPGCGTGTFENVNPSPAGIHPHRHSLVFQNF